MIVFLGTDDAGHESAVTLRIVGASVVVQVIVSGDHVAAQQIRVGGMDTGIDDSDSDAFSRQSLIPGCFHSDGLHPPLIPEIRIIGSLQQLHRSVSGLDGFHRIEILNALRSQRGGAHARHQQDQHCQYQACGRYSPCCRSVHPSHSYPRFYGQKRSFVQLMHERPVSFHDFTDHHALCATFSSYAFKITEICALVACLLGSSPTLEPEMIPLCTHQAMASHAQEPTSCTSA